MAERLLGFVLQRGESLTELLLVLGELPGLFTQRAHGVGKLGCCLLTKVFLQLLQLTLGPRAGAQGLRELAFAQLLGRIDHLLPRLFQLLAGVVQFLLLRRLSHLVAEFIRVVQKLLLVVAQPLELSLQLFFLRFGLGRAKSRLQFLELFVHSLLTLGEFLQSVEHREVFLLTLTGLLLSLLLVFVPVLFVRQFEFFHLLFGGTGTAARAARALRPLHDEMLSGAQLEQPLIGRLFGSGGGGERRETRFAQRLPECPIGGGHLFGNRREDVLRLRVGKLLGESFELFDGLLLAVADHGDLLGQLRVPFLLVRPHDFPSRDDDLLLKFGELRQRVALLLASRCLRFATRWSFQLAEDFLERPDLGEVEIAARATLFSIGTEVVGIDVVRDQLIRLDLQLFEPLQVRELSLLGAWLVFAERDRERFAAGDGEHDPGLDETEVVGSTRLDEHLFQGRNLHVLSGERELQFRRTIGERLEPELFGIAVHATSIVGQDKLQLVTLRRDKVGLIDKRVRGIGRQCQ